MEWGGQGADEQTFLQCLFYLKKIQCRPLQSLCTAPGRRVSKVLQSLLRLNKLDSFFFPFMCFY